VGASQQERWCNSILHRWDDMMMHLPMSLQIGKATGCCSKANDVLVVARCLQMREQGGGQGRQDGGQWCDVELALADVCCHGGDDGG